MFTHFKIGALVSALTIALSATVYSSVQSQAASPQPAAAGANLPQSATTPTPTSNPKSTSIPTLNLTFPSAPDSVPVVTAVSVAPAVSIQSPVSATPKPVALPLTGVTILLDPGHGGKDPGAISGGVEEKNITLAVSLLLRDKLQALGAKVLMTRDSDKTLTLQERLDDSNRYCPDLFVSVHGNSVRQTRINGIETYYFGSRGEALASTLLHNFAHEINEQPKWSHDRNLFVLDGNNVPATLVEIGYLTNSRTRALLRTAAYQDKVAAALANSVVTYLTNHNAARGCYI